MCKLCRKSIGGNKRIEQVRKVVHRIIRSVKPKKLVLFGSFARGDYSEASDADFLVVADFEEKFFDRIGKILDLRDGELEVDALPYTPEEFEKMVSRGNPLVIRALKEGINLA